MFKKHQKNFNNKCRTPLTRAAAVLLTAALFITSAPITAYADEAGVGGNVGGEGTGNMGASEDYKAWSRTHQGYRFYIINSNLERVTDIYDFVFSNPASAAANVGALLKTTRFDTASSPNGWSYQNMDMLASLTGSTVSDIPYPVSNNKGRGKEFRNWFLRNMPAGNNGDGGTGGGGSNIIYAGGTPVEENTSGYQSPTAVNGTTRNGESLSEAYQSNCEIGSNIIFGTNSPTLGSLEIPERAVVNSIISQQQYLREFFANSMMVAYESYGMCEKDAKFYATYQLFIHIMQIKGGTANPVWATTEIRKAITNDVAKYIAKTIYSTINSTDIIFTAALPINANAGISLLEQSIPLAGSADNETQSVVGCPALTILNEVGAIQVPGYETALQALMDNHYLIVEPITWLYIPSNGTNYPTTRTYGSYYNIANKWFELGGKDTGGFYASYMTKLGNNCMLLTGNITTETGATFASAAKADRNISTSVVELEYSGLSMHLYSSDMFDDDDDDVTPDPVVVESDYTLTESQLTRKVTTSDPTDPEDNLSTQNLEIAFPELSTTHESCYCGGHCTNTGESHTSSCVKCSVCGSGGTWGSNCSGTKADGSPCTNTGGSWGYGNCTNSNHTNATPCSNDKVNDGTCTHEKSTCSDLTNCTNKQDSTMSLTDSDVTITLKNTITDTNNIIANTSPYTHSFTATGNDKTATRTSNDTHKDTDAHTATVNGYEYEFIIHRANVDPTNQYSQGSSDNLKNLGFPIKNAAPSANREENGTAIHPITMLFQDNSTAQSKETSTQCDHQTHTSCEVENCTHRCTHTDTQAATIGGVELNSTVGIETYAGEQRGYHSGCTQPSNLAVTPGLSELSGNNETTGIKVPSTSLIKFTPYIKMQDCAKNKEVNVLGKYARAILPNNYAELSSLYPI